MIYMLLPLAAFLAGYAAGARFYRRKRNATPQAAIAPEHARAEHFAMSAKQSAPRDNSKERLLKEVSDRNNQLGKVYLAMKDNQWHTLKEISDNAGAQEYSIPSISAKLRTLRSLGHLIECRRSKGEPSQYRMVG